MICFRISGNRARSGQAVEYLYGGSTDDDAVFDAIVQKAFFFQLIQVVQQVVEETCRVEDIDLLAVDLQLVPRKQFKELIEGTEAAGQDDGCVAAFVHHLFAGMHIRDDGQLGKSFMMVFPFGEKFRDNAHDIYAFGEGGVGHQAHQARAAAAVDEFQAEDAYIAGYLDGMAGEEGINAAL